MTDPSLCGAAPAGRWNKPTKGTGWDQLHNSGIFYNFFSALHFKAQRTAIGSRMKNAHCFGLFLPR